MQACPGGLRWEFFVAASSRHKFKLRESSCLRRRGARRLKNRTLPFCKRGHMSACSTHPAESPQSTQPRAIAPTFNGSLAGTVAFRTDPHFAAELLGWHGVGLYARPGAPWARDSGGAANQSGLNLALRPAVFPCYPTRPKGGSQRLVVTFVIPDMEVRRKLHIGWPFELLIPRTPNAKQQVL
jgi:hypothetical protein